MDGEDWLHDIRKVTTKQRNTKEIRFRDLNPDYTQDDKPLILEEELAIRGRIRLVLGSLLESEDFLPSFASNLPLRLYDSIGDTTAYLLEMDTLIALTTWMNDEIIVGANVTFTPIDELDGEDGYIVNIPFVIRRSNAPALYSFQVLR